MNPFEKPPEAFRTPPKQEKAVPEKSLFASYDKLFYYLKLATHPSKAKGIDRGEEVQRPLAARATRAELLNQFKETPASDREARRTIIAEGHARDEITREYLRQGDVKVFLPYLGEQKARYTILNPPESRRTSENENKPPIFFIPGIANDIDCVGALVQELAYSGRKTIVVGMPESHMGTVTPEFVKAAADTPTFGPHVEFYKEAIKNMTGDGPAELWGHSTGSPIIAEILQDPAFQAKVSNAVLLCPASSANISKAALGLAIASESTKLLNRNIPKYTLTTGPAEKPADDRQKGLKSALANTMLKKVCTKSNAWETARVQDGGNIVVYSGEKDEMTKSYQLFKNDSGSTAAIHDKNPQIDVVSIPEASHTTPLLYPAKAIEQVGQAQHTV